MPELTFATFDELQAEIARRCPAYVLILRYHPEGQKTVQHEHFSCGMQSGARSEALGLLRWGTLALEEKMKAELKLTTGIQPLEPPR